MSRTSSRSQPLAAGRSEQVQIREFYFTESAITIETTVVGDHEHVAYLPFEPGQGISSTDENHVENYTVLISLDGAFSVRKTLKVVAQEFDFHLTAW